MQREIDSATDHGKRKAGSEGGWTGKAGVPALRKTTEATDRSANKGRAIGRRIRRSS